MLDFHEKRKYIDCSTVVMDMWEDRLIFIPLKMTWYFHLDNNWEVFLGLYDFFFLPLLGYLRDIYFIILCQLFMEYLVFFKSVDSSFFDACQFSVSIIFPFSVLLYCYSSRKSVAIYCFFCLSFKGIHFHQWFFLQ